MVKIEGQTLDPRRALKVLRYHTWPVHHHQSVGEHTTQIWRILKAIWPDIPMRVLDYVLVHDMPELVLGDPPYPSKLMHPGIKPILKELENDVLEQMINAGWGIPKPEELTIAEFVIFKFAEFVDMWEHGLDELALGNATATLIVDRTFKGLQGCLSQMRLAGEASIIERSHSYVMNRIMYHREIMRLSHGPMEQNL